MDKFDRIQSLHRLLKHRKTPITTVSLAQRLECSPKTVARTIEQMRDHLNAPIVYDRARHGYHYEHDLAGMFELPGIWLTAEELQSLTALLNLINSMGNSLLKDELQGVEAQLKKLLTARGISVEEFEQRVKFLPMASRVINSEIFATISEALLNRRQLNTCYRSYTQQQTQRPLSPQTLIYYRENWYLDAWCHLRNDLRTFSISRFEKTAISSKPAKKISQQQQQAHFADSFGIFAGKGRHVATLRFLPAIAREIANQQWHPRQQGEWQGDHYLLSFPYSDDRELVQDILKHTPHVVVEAPALLKKAVKNKLQQGLEQYLDKGLGWL